MNKLQRLAMLIVVPVSILPLAHAQVDAIYDQGSNALIKQLKRLQTTASVLHTGAHPDDEDSALVAYHARGQNARTAYISLTRGSGGQNIIGAEQSDALGVIRTEELLQARRLDGAEQYFTRANDFGFSKYRTEASRIWPEQEVLGDMVRTIRLFRPDVIVSRWNGTATDGHGHHQFSGYLTPLAMAAAADPAQFPEHLDEGLAPWQTQKLYMSVRVNPESTTGPLLRIDTGQYDPITGKSYFEIGMQGRSQQKTQQMGSLELQGEQLSVLQLSDAAFSTDANEQSVFDGIDTSISGIARFEEEPSDTLEDLLRELESISQNLLAVYDPFNPQALIPELVRSHDVAHLARDAANSVEAIRLLDEKIAEIEQALLLASGVTVDALIDRETLVPGSSVMATVRTYIPDDLVVSLVGTAISIPDGWSIATSNQPLANEVGSRRREVAEEENVYQIAIPADAKPTQPYWLELPREGAAYDWGNAQNSQTLAFDPPLLMATAELEIGGKTIQVRKEVEYRQLDRVRGEVRRRVDVVPRASVEAATSLLVLPAANSDEAVEILISVRNNGDEPISGTAQLSLPQGWTSSPAFAVVSLEAAPSIGTYSFVVNLPANVQAGEYRLAATATIDGEVYRETMLEIAYPHISTHRVYSVAETEIEVVDVEVADVNVGYVMGSGDLVPESLRRLGVNVTQLSDTEITQGDLSEFDVIVVGIRASQTRPAFVANNQRLLSYAEQGGTLVVQYQQPDFAAQNLAPFDVAMERNVRVVDETAPITILDPEHPVFSYPNQISSEDFEGWVQERNNYNFTSFDRERYTPLTEAHDEGEPPSDGAMLYAPLGDGHYVYTSYSWFRQLPNGIPGAYRIFANLLSLPAADF